MKPINKFVIPLVLGIGVLGFSAASASAYVVCSGSDCWHVHERYEYPPDAGVVIHDDSWNWAPSDHYAWREHEGRGYWRGDTWTDW